MSKCVVGSAALVANIGEPPTGNDAERVEGTPKIEAPKTAAAACVSAYEPSPLSQEERLTLNAVVARAKLLQPRSLLDMRLLHERLTSLHHNKKRQHPILGGALSIILSAASILPSYRGAGCHHTNSCRLYRTEDIVAALTSIIPTPSAIIA
jgi:hypothetical protein